MKNNTLYQIGKFKCFHKPSGFNQIFPINIIIGKNNSGKSSLLTLIEFLVKREKEILKNSDNTYGIVFYETLITDEMVKKIYPSGSRSSYLQYKYITDYDFGKNLIGRRIGFDMSTYEKPQAIAIDFDFDIVHADALDKALKKFNSINASVNVFDNKIFRNISAERDITMEIIDDADFEVTKNGKNVTRLIELIVNNAYVDGKLIEETLLNELNSIVYPEMEFSDIIPQKTSTQNWEIFLEDMQGTRIALSQMGSGLKTILLVLLNLMVIPKFEKKEKSNYVFCFEELENNLHPALQRKLFKYIETYARKNNCIFFITTHSNVVIDTFGSSEIAQIIHIKNINGETTVNNISSHKDYKNLLQDLDIKASDLLQSNGIIWVEGPSDRIYINRFINLINPNLIEGVNYSIMYYGGRLLSNLSFDYDAFTDNLIPLLKINHNSFVIMDRDGEKPSTSLNKTKKRISNEIGVDNFWITKGREIENYLHESVIANWLSQKTNEKIDDLNLDNDTKIEISIEKVNPLLKYNKNKTAYSKEIVQHINVEHLDILDLKKKLNILLNTIEKWNNL